MEAGYFGLAPGWFGGNFPGGRSRRFVNSCAFSDYGYNFPRPLFSRVRNEIKPYRACESALSAGRLFFRRSGRHSRCRLGRRIQGAVAAEKQGVEPKDEAPLD